MMVRSPSPRSALFIAIALAGCSTPTTPASTSSAITAQSSSITNSADDLRTGWYPDQAALSPQVVGGSTFGRLFSNVGTPWNASDVGCGDLVPTIGVTGTPVIDPVSNTAFFFSKTYVNASAAWFAHAVNVTTGAERPNFPVEIRGSASNDPSVSFLPKVQMQRPGLLLMNGVVYAAFGAHCDFAKRPNELYRGWIAAVS